MKKSRVKKNKRLYLFLDILLLVVVVALVIIGGIHERGYYWPASEILLLPLGIGWIAFKRKETTK